MTTETTVEMPPDKLDVKRIYHIRWNYWGAGQPMVYVVLKYEPPRYRHMRSTYTYHWVRGKALEAIQIARDPYLAKKYGAIVT